MHTFYENRMEVDSEHLPVSIYTNHDFSFLAHWHPETELAWVKTGSIRIGVNNDTYILNPGDICLIRSGDIHYYESLSTDLCIVIMVCHTDLVEEFASWTRRNRPATSILRAEQLKQQNLLHCTELLELLQRQQSEKRTAYTTYMKTLGSQILIELLRNWPVQPLTKNQSDRGDTGLHHVKDLLLFIDEHITADLSLESLSKEFHLDPYYLSKLFNRTTGMHFRVYLNEKRVLLAKEKLTEKKYSGDIAWDCGFNSVRNFNRVFKSVTGMTPGEYKSIVV